MTDEEMQEAARSIQQQIEAASKEFTQAGVTEPMAMAVAAILAGRVVACDHKIKRLESDIQLLTDLIADLEAER